MAEEMTYTGGCHCGKVRWEVTAAVDKVLACNCSICSKKASRLFFVPAARFRLLQGERDLADYQFGKKRIHHVFCTTCGIHSFARGSDRQGNETRAINANCLDGEHGFAVTHFDGKSL